MAIPKWAMWAGAAAVGVGGVVVYHKHQSAKSANGQQQGQSQASPITTIPYAVGLNYGNGYSGGGRMGRTPRTAPTPVTGSTTPPTTTTTTPPTTTPAPSTSGGKLQYITGKGVQGGNGVGQPAVTSATAPAGTKYAALQYNSQGQYALLPYQSGSPSAMNLGGYLGNYNGIPIYSPGGSQSYSAGMSPTVNPATAQALGIVNPGPQAYSYSGA